MNGAIGIVKGFMFPDGFDPNSSNPEVRGPICVLVEFEDVDLGTDEQGRPWSFFPDEPEKRNWIPFYRETAYSVSEQDVCRKQFPLTLAWALTHWKAQGMTLNRVRISLGNVGASTPGLGYVAVTRVKHYRDVVFETDLPPYEVFQDAKWKEDFRARVRYERRLQARFSRTLRRYGFCEGYEWTADDAAAAEKLLDGLRLIGKDQLRSLEGSGRPLDEDAHLWPEGEPDFEKLLKRCALELAGADDEYLGRLERVAGRLLRESVEEYGPLHEPAIREALGCLIPEDLHWREDGKPPKGRKRVSDGVERFCVNLMADRWQVDVCEETGLVLPGRALRADVVEFF